LKPGARFADYKQIAIDPVTISYKSPPWICSTDR